MNNDDLHNDLDELAGEIMQSKQEFQTERENWDDTFDPKYRRMEEAEVDPSKLFG